ncbi:hypothetical protein [Sciscionella marina]|uniref:hypothetical protein n=1 Tax=Sciscionella marina TaxID=508770 RepID=UPI0012F62BE0|nr:hypothetical protein [Sciscionella marina]
MSTQQPIPEAAMNHYQTTGQATPWRHELNGVIPELVHCAGTWWYRDQQETYRPSDPARSNDLGDYDRRLDLAHRAISDRDVR